MRKTMRYFGSRAVASSPPGPLSLRERGNAALLEPSSLRFRDHVQLVDRQAVHHLRPPRWPPNRHAAQALLAQSKVQAPVVLAAKPRAAVHHLPLPAGPDLHCDFGADRSEE